jgi:hypothetical protein
MGRSRVILANSKLKITAGIVILLALLTAPAPLLPSHRLAEGVQLLAGIGRKAAYLFAAVGLQIVFYGAIGANYSTNTVAYTGTHDNDATRGWFESLPETERRKVWRCLNRTEGDTREIAGELLRVAWSSVAALAIAPFQDLLNLGSEARMNLPGTAEGNWRWRATEDMLNALVFDQSKDLIANANRLCLTQGSAVANAAQAGT